MESITAAAQEVNNRLADATLNLFDMLIGFLRDAPEPDFINPEQWFTDQYAIALQIGLWLTVPFAVLATIQALMKGGVSEVVKVYLVGLPVAILGGAIGLVFVGFMVLITNDLCELLFSGMQQNADQFASTIRQSALLDDFFSPEGGDQPGSLSMFLAIAVFMTALLVGLLVLFLELIVRNVAIYMAVLFLPLALAAYLWAPTRKWLSRIVQIVAVLILAKFAILAVMSFTLQLATLIGSGGGALSGAQLFGLFILMIVGLFMSTVAAPLVISFVFRPDFEADESSFRNLRQQSAFNTDAYETRNSITGLGKKLFGGGG